MAEDSSASAAVLSTCLPRTETTLTVWSFSAPKSIPSGHLTRIPSVHWKTLNTLKYILQSRLRHQRMFSQRLQISCEETIPRRLRQRKEPANLSLRIKFRGLQASFRNTLRELPTSSSWKTIYTISTIIRSTCGTICPAVM